MTTIDNLKKMTVDELAQWTREHMPPEGDTVRLANAVIERGEKIKKLEEILTAWRQHSK